MQKKLIVVAVASVLAMPLAAQAGVEVYGKAIVSVEATDNGREKGDAMNLSTNQSRIAFKGTEELDGGLTFVWQWENYVNFDTGGWGGQKVDNGDESDSEDNKLEVKGRNTYVGFTGDFGTALAGNYDSPYKMVVSNMDPFKDLAADFNSMMGKSKKGFKHADRLNNVLAYVSPEMSGFQFLGGYKLEGGTGAENNDAYSLAGVYKTGPLKVAAAYQVVNKSGYTDASGAVSDDEAVELGVTYSFGKTDLSLIYEVTDSGEMEDDSTGKYKDTDQSKTFFAIKHKVNKSTLAFSYTVVDSYGDSEDTGATQLSAGVYQKLSKKTKVYVTYSAIDNEKGAKFDLYNKTGAAKGDDPSIFSVGVISKFSSL